MRKHFHTLTARFSQQPGLEVRGGLIVFTHQSNECPDSAELVRSDVAGDRRLRLANSSPDVKALFNSTPYIYNLEEHEDPQTNYVPDYWTPLPPIVCRILLYIFMLVDAGNLRALGLLTALGTQTMH